jgi:uncharacterized protein
VPAHPLRLNAAELLRQPGSTRPVETSITAADLEIDDARISGPVVVALSATSSIDGISVHGEVRTPWHGECRRCLVDVDGVTVSEVDERYSPHPVDADTIEIVDGQIDLAPLVREYVMLDLPDAPLCRPDCAGICPQCGADRNVAACDCDTAPSDPRWAALADLRLDDET